MTSIAAHRLAIAGLFVALAATIYYYSNLPQPTPCEDYSQETPSTLETEVIDKMIQKYRSNQLVAIKPTISDPNGDAHSVWFDLKTLKKFIYHIEYNVKNTDPTNTEELGLRLYYAAYDPTDMSKPDMRDVDPTYVNRHTVVMIPTIYNKAAGHVDFNPLDETSYKGYISQTKAPNAETLPYQQAGYTPMALTNNQRVIARNHGSLIPPADKMVEGF